MNKKKFKMTLRSREMMHGYLFILPWFIGFLFFFVTNIYQTVEFSFSKVNLLEGGGFEVIFNGIGNYRYAFLEHANFTRTLVESLQNMLIDVPLITFFALFMAIILNRKFKFRGVLRALFFLPVIMETEAVVGALTNTQQALAGGVSNIPTEFQGTEGFSMMAMMGALADYGIPAEAMTYLASAAGRIYDIMRSGGVQIVIFIAALQSIAPALYEVAHIEGATPYETFWKVTLPMISPLIITNVVYTIVMMFTNSEIVEMARLTGTGGEYNFGLSAVMSLTSATITGVILMVVVVILNKLSFYQN